MRKHISRLRDGIISSTAGACGKRSSQPSVSLLCACPKVAKVPAQPKALTPQKATSDVRVSAGYAGAVMSFAECGTKRGREDGELHLPTPQAPIHKRARVRVVKVVQSVLTKYFTSNVASAPLPPKTGVIQEEDE